MNNQLNLGNLTDKQKIWLSQLSYLDINKEGRDKIANGGMTVSELKQYMDNPNQPFCGDAWLGEKNFNKIAGMVLGDGQIPTKSGVVDILIQNGLGDLKITNISEEQKIVSSGFQALTFEDPYGNVGISYRGSDFDFSRGGARDWVESDIMEYFSNGSTQRNEALEYFNANKSKSGNNYVYGHSLGGNLTSHVYVENYNEIQEAFTINGNPINQKLLDTPEKIAAFNDKKKYNCNVISGDIVGHFKSCELYENNVNYIQNNGSMKSSAISAHLVQSASFDSEGNFIKDTKEAMVKKMGPVANAFMGFIKNVREVMNEIGSKISGSDSKQKETYETYKADLYNSFENKFKEINYDSASLELDTEHFDEQKDERLRAEFQNAARRAESEQIQKIKMLLEQRKSAMMSSLYGESEQIEDTHSHTL